MPYTWTDYAGAIVAYFDTLSYIRVASNRELEDAPLVNNKTSYVLKAEGSDDVQMINDTLIGSYIVRIEIGYINLSSADRDTSYDSFDTVVVAGIKALSEFLGFIDKPKIEDIDEKHSKGILNFYYGIRTL